EGALNVNIRAAAFAYRDFITDLDLEAGDIDFAAIDEDVTMADQLPGLRTRHRVAETIDDIVEATFEQGEQVLAGDAFRAYGALEIEPELALQHAVNAFDLLLLAQLLAVTDELGATDVAAVLAGWLRAAFFNRAARLVAALALQKQLHSFPAAETAHRATISS